MRRPYCVPPGGPDRLCKDGSPDYCRAPHSMGDTRNFLRNFITKQCFGVPTEIVGSRFDGCGPAFVVISTVNRTIGISYTNRSIMLAGSRADAMPAGGTRQWFTTHEHEEE